MSDIFCGDCPYCIPKETDQTKVHEIHICKLYKVRLLHGGNHPNILKYIKCQRDNFKKLNCLICGKDIVISEDDFACIDPNCKLGHGVNAFIIHLKFILHDTKRIYRERI
jgi:hypothetical protein